MKDLTFEDALFNHELDVAGKEIWDYRKQLDNLKIWLARVKPLERSKVDDLLARIERGGGAPLSERRRAGR
jgi:hypothetical protein